jgi:hypothetical protein
LNFRTADDRIAGKRGRETALAVFGLLLLSLTVAPVGADNPSVRPYHAFVPVLAADGAQLPAQTASIVAISVCSGTGTSSGSCPNGTLDTHQVVLGPDHSNPVNTIGVAATSDEHLSVFPPGSLGDNADYLFFVASGVEPNPGIGVAVLSGGSGPGSNGQWTMNLAMADGYGVYPGGANGTVFLEPMKEDKCPLVSDPTKQDQTFDLNYAAAGSIVPSPGQPGSLIMVYEGSNTCVDVTSGERSGEGAYISTGIATSIDDGHSWPTYRGTANFAFTPLPANNPSQGPKAPLGATGASVCVGNDCSSIPTPDYGRYPVITLPESLANVMSRGTQLNAKIGEGEPSAYMNPGGPYLYVVHGALAQKPLPNGRASDLTVARARISGAGLLSFEKWDGGSFSQPGIGGQETPILPDGPYQNCGDTSQERHSGSISYVDDTHQYLLLFVCSSPTDPASGKNSGGAAGAAWFYATSDDLSDQNAWSSPREITGSWSQFEDPSICHDFKGWYPSLMSLGHQPGHLATSGYAFYLYGCLGGAGNQTPPKRQFSSRAFTITTGPASPGR